jgi:hypothetical protein
MAALNMTDSASNFSAPHGHRIDQQQSPSRLSVQEQCIPAVNRIIQPIRPIARRPCGIASSNTYNNCLNLANPHGPLLHQQRLPYSDVQEKFVPARTSDRSITAYSQGYSSGTNSGLTLSSHLPLPAAQSSQPLPLPPGHVPVAYPEEQEFNVTPSKVSHSPGSHKLHIMWMYVYLEI